MPRGDVGDREPALLFGDRGVELDLVEQIAELLDQVVVSRLVVGVERVDRVDHLVGLLDQVRDEAGVGLLAVPRTLARAACGRAGGSARTLPPTGAASDGM